MGVGGRLRWWRNRWVGSERGAEGVSRRSDDLNESVHDYLKHDRDVLKSWIV